MIKKCMISKMHSNDPNHLLCKKMFDSVVFGCTYNVKYDTVYTMTDKSASMIMRNRAWNREE